MFLALGFVNALTSQNSVPELYKNVADAVVSIETDESSGSGFYAYNGEYLITAAHVIKGVSYIKVDGKSNTIDGIHFFDSETDIAILKLAKNSNYSIPFRKKDDLEIGSKVFVVSNQLGFLEDSITDGILSSYRAERNFLQFTASVNPGSSGAPLLDGSGNVIGLVTFKMTESAGLGFAIGIKKLRQSLSEAIKRGAKKENFTSGLNAKEEDKVSIGKLAQATEELNLYKERNANSEVLSKANAKQYLVLSKTVDDWAGIVLVNGKLGWVPETKLIKLPFDVMVSKKNHSWIEK